jgi:hypothetical protein
MEGHTSFWRKILDIDYKKVKNNISEMNYLIREYDKKTVTTSSCPKLFKKIQTLRKWVDSFQGLINNLESYEHAITDQLISIGRLNSHLFFENSVLRSEIKDLNKLNLILATNRKESKISKTNTQNEKEQIHHD